MDAAIVLYDGFDELDAIGPHEVFRKAAEEGADLTTTLRAVDGAGEVVASHGLRVGTDGALADADPDLLVVPGGGWNDGSEAGARAEAERGAVPEAIATHHDRGGTVASVCTGGMLVARAGLVEGRPAVTHAGALEDLRDAGAEVVDARVVDDGDLLTAGGVTAGLDLAVHVLEREFGGTVAAAVRERMEYEPRGRVHATRD